MSAAANDRSIQLECQIDALEQAVTATLDVIVVRAGWGADGVDAALRAALRELGIAIFEIGGLEAMQAVAREAVVDAPPNNTLCANYLRRVWRGIEDSRGRWR